MARVLRFLGFLNFFATVFAQSCGSGGGSTSFQCPKNESIVSFTANSGGLWLCQISFKCSGGSTRGPFADGLCLGSMDTLSCPDGVASITLSTALITSLLQVGVVQATVKCRSGASKSWSSISLQTPCSAITCPVYFRGMTVGANGGWNSLQSVTCGANCGSAPIPVNASAVSCASTFASDSCSYQCNPGFTLSGASSISCGVSGSWTTAGMCTPVTCSDLIPPNNGNVGNCNSVIYPNTCTQSCGTGYELTFGSLIRQCQMNGTLSPTTAICSPVICSDLTGPLNGDVGNCSSVPYISTCSQTCNSGYYLFSGSLDRTCEADGDLTPSTAECKPVNCSDTTDPNNGKLNNCDFVVYPNNCSESCNMGYASSGSLHRTCQGSGVLSPSTTNCLPIICDGTSIPINAIATSNCGANDPYDTECVLECVQGYQVTSGSNSRTCNISAPGPYPPSDLVCEDIDECTGVNDCDLNANCTNTDGSYTCACNSGFTGTGDSCLSCIEVSAMFSWNDASLITLIFSQNAISDQFIDAILPCNELFDSQSLLFLTGSSSSDNWQNIQCRWKSLNSLAISGSTRDALIMPVQQFLASPAQTPAAYRTCPFQVQSPPNPVVPIPNIYAPSEVGMCTGSVTLDASGTTGLAYRLGMFEWFLDGQGIASNVNPKLIYSLPSTGTFNFTLFVTNVFGKSAVQDFVLTKRNQELPIIILPLPSSWSTQDTQVVTPFVDPVDCQGSPMNPSEWSFHWSILPAPHTSIDLNQPTLYIPSHSLLPGLFTISLTVNMQTDIVTTSSTVQIALSPLRVRIFDSSESKVQFGVSNAITFSAASSFDPDVAIPNLSYTHLWSCTDLSTQSACLLQPSSFTSASGDLVLPPGTLAVGHYLLTLNFSSISIDYPFPLLRSSFATMKVLIVEEDIPQITITGSSERHARSDFLHLQVRVTNPDGTDFDLTTASIAWRETAQDFMLESNSLVSFSNDLTAIEIAPFALQEDTKYEFVFVVLSDSQSWTVNASVLIYVGSAPRAGLCSFSPAQGIALETAFFLFCENWLTSFEPLRYQFFYRGLNSKLIALTDFQFTHLASGYLPVGNTTIVVFISDSTGSYTEFTIPTLVEVFPAPHNGSAECFANSVINNLLARVQLFGNADQLFQLTQSITTILLESTKAVAAPDCASQQETLETFREQLWIELLVSLDSLTSQPYISAGEAHQLAQTLVQVVSALKDSIELSPDPLLITHCLNISRVLIQHISSRADLTGLVIETLSSLLETVECAAFENVAELINLLSDMTLLGTIPGQSTAINNFLANIVGFSAQRVQNTPCVLSVNNLTFNFSQELLEQGGYNDSQYFVDITIVRYGKALRRCRIGNDGRIPQGDIVTVDLSRNKTRVSVSNLTEYFPFQLPVDESILSNLGVDDILSCHWWNPLALRWQTEGCITNGKPQRGASGDMVLQCECSHLTDFSVLVAERYGNGLKPTPPLYTAFGYIYAVATAIALIQVSRILYESYLNLRHKTDVRCPCKCSNLLWQHVLIAIVCFTRCISSFRYGGQFSEMDSVSIGLISCLPYAFIFWIYTLLVFQWASLYHFTMSGSQLNRDPFSVVKPIFLFCNVLILITVFTIFFTITSPNKSGNPEIAALAGSILMSILYIVSSIVFLIYAFLMGNSLNKTASSTHSGSIEGKEKSRWQLPPLTVSQKMKLAGCIVSFCFGGESIMWALSIGMKNRSSEAAIDTYTAIFLSLEILSLAAILNIFRKAVKDQGKSRKSASQRLTSRSSGVSRISQKKSTPSLPNRTTQTPQTITRSGPANGDDISTVDQREGDQIEISRTDIQDELADTCEDIELMKIPSGSTELPRSSSSQSGTLTTSARALLPRVSSDSNYLLRSSSHSPSPVPNSTPSLQDASIHDVALAIRPSFRFEFPTKPELESA